MILGSNVIRFPVELRAMASFDLLSEIAPDSRQVELIAEAFGFDAPDPEIRSKADRAMAEAIAKAHWPADPKERRAALNAMLKPLVDCAVAACAEARQAALLSDEAGAKLAGAQMEGGYWLAPLDGCCQLLGGGVRADAAGRPCGRAGGPWSRTGDWARQAWRAVASVQRRRGCRCADSRAEGFGSLRRHRAFWGRADRFPPRRDSCSRRHLILTSGRSESWQIGDSRRSRSSVGDAEARPGRTNGRRGGLGLVNCRSNDGTICMPQSGHSGWSVATRIKMSQSTLADTCVWEHEDRRIHCF